MKRIGIVLVSLLVFTSLALANVINVPGDSTTIQTGINGASNGDTVLVQPGTYIENINFNGRNIVLGSLFSTTGDTSHISTTIIDGDSSGSVVTFENGEDSTTVIIGFTLQNGARSHGGGIWCPNSSPYIANCVIYNNTSDRDKDSEIYVINADGSGLTGLGVCGYELSWMPIR